MRVWWYLKKKFKMLNNIKIYGVDFKIININKKW